MADPKKDASTTIEADVTSFCSTINAELKSWREKVKKEKGDEFGTEDTCGAAYMPEVTFKLSTGKDSKARTPEEQAIEVARNKSWVCWGAHMSDKARHVLMTVDGTVSWDPDVAFHMYFNEFKTKWGAAMKKHGLLNYNSKEGYGEGDAFHLELPDARIDKGDARAEACLEEYVRLTREGDKYKKNEKFEKKYEGLLKPYIKKYEKK
jgi:hypothetical protein